ncbi:hypothetical protein Hanom_Chr06g00514071 [Helianthus anomalus]
MLVFFFLKRQTHTPKSTAKKYTNVHYGTRTHTTRVFPLLHSLVSPCYKPFGGC